MHRKREASDDLERGTATLMQIGDTVLHPRYGIGVIDHIEKRDQDGESREFYVIRSRPSAPRSLYQWTQPVSWV